MKVKKFQAANMSEVMNQIKSELGTDAVILNSKAIYSGGFLGFFKKKSFEVIAAIDPDIHDERALVRKEKVRKVERSLNHAAPAKVSEKIVQLSKENGQDKVLDELIELKKIVKKLNVQHDTRPLHEHIQFVVDTLHHQEILQHYIDDIIIVLSEELAQREMTMAECVELTKDYLVEQLSHNPVTLFTRKYVNVVGPTGVGKTTTLAKLAAERVLKHHKKVAFITTDTYRIAAIDQLKTYAKILNVPIEVAYNSEDFQKALEKFAHYDTVFVDTAGRNFRNKEFVVDLQNMISFDEEMETYLVLSLTSKQKDMDDIFNQFSLIPISYFIFTKMDETASYGSILNMMMTYKIGTAYITNGQNVPDDILKMTPTTIVESIFGDINHERSS